MSSAKRLREDTLPGPPSKKGNITRRVAIDPSKASFRASSLRVLSNGRVGTKKLNLAEEHSASSASNAPGETPFDFPPALDDSQGVSESLFDAGAEQELRNGKKKKSDTNSSKLNEWLQFRESFLLEILRGYGIGDSFCTTNCASCDLETG
ncbi:hypothetical protein BDN70DRAFT_902331, partial [Pholiota conissans]